MLHIGLTGYCSETHDSSSALNPDVARRGEIPSFAMEYVSDGGQQHQRYSDLHLINIGTVILEVLSLDQSPCKVGTFAER